MYEFNVHNFVSILVFRVHIIHSQLNDYKRFTYCYLLTYFLLTYIYTKKNQRLRIRIDRNKWHC